MNHIRGCVVKILYPTLPRFQSKMAIVWDRSISKRRRIRRQESDGDGGAGEKKERKTKAEVVG